ncbi:zinc-binding dehydrogenase [Mesobacillus subterraneus]|uniref:zinc-binding dehydrogenase n=1 Tax=Mesobacillus subterraneus TaxID=285983 RepID=UPI00203C4F9E|nr:zinc-binding dehydrogenase [Mesobacillus subterraneus]MCM3665080.1 zinc-binding dehydrogenase [Mesobacillus subterraneus]MCM3684094.1 zinc-binding dehydrogenase [Mesobacillus subterraneus]
MKALLLEDKGKVFEMKVGTVDKPAPGKGEILVKIVATALNPVDYKTGNGGNPNWTFPHILGLDSAGIVEEAGTDVTNVKVGDRVVYHGDLTKKGGFAEYGVTTAHTVSLIPEGISFEDAAALPTAGYTAYQTLFHKMHASKGQTILVHAGAGGVGGFAIQLAKNAGLTVLTTASSANHEYVRSLGADHAIDYHEEDFAEKALEITNGLGVDLVLDTVGRDNADKSLKALAFNGQIAFIAGPPNVNDAISFAHPLSFHQVALGSVHQSNNMNEQRKLAEMGDHMLSLLQDGKINALVEKVISLEEVPEALAELSTRRVKGKIVAKIN